MHVRMAGVSNSAAYKRYQRVIIERLEGEIRLLREEIEMLRARLKGSGKGDSPSKHARERTYYVAEEPPAAPTDEVQRPAEDYSEAQKHYADALSR